MKAKVLTLANLVICYQMERAEVYFLLNILTKIIIVKKRYIMSIKGNGEQGKYYMERENLIKSMDILHLCSTKDNLKIFVSMEIKEY